jgi:hypothetical protein
VKPSAHSVSASSTKSCRTIAELGPALLCNLQRATHQKVYLKQLVRVLFDDYEPGGRRVRPSTSKQLCQSVEQVEQVEQQEDKLFHASGG